MTIRPLFHKIKFNIQNFFFQFPFIYRKYLGDKFDSNPDHLVAVSSNAVLKKEKEINYSVDKIKRMGLPLRSGKTKNWDTLIAYSEIVKNTSREAVILDAGAELYSMVLPWLFLSGYRNLFGNNLVFSKKIKRGSIQYDHGDITSNKFQANSFDAVTCLSVIEHGVELETFFKEMARILKPGGLLIISTDYFENSIDTKGKFEYGHQIKIFERSEIENMIKIAQQHNLNITSNIDLSCEEKPVRWERFDLEYTFICLSFKKEI